MSRGYSLFSKSTASRRPATALQARPTLGAQPERFDAAMEARDRRLMLWLLTGHLAAALTIFALVYLVGHSLADRPTERRSGQQRLLMQRQQRPGQMDDLAPRRLPASPRALLPSAPAEVGPLQPTELTPSWMRQVDLEAAPAGR